MNNILEEFYDYYGVVSFLSVYRQPLPNIFNFYLGPQNCLF